MKNVRNILTVVALATTTLLTAAEKRQPNVIILLSDDQGWGDLGFTGNTTVRTPNIDKMAHDGMTMDNFYVCAVSSPTRAELLTGRYHLRSGVCSTSTGGERMNLDEQTIAEHFRDGGYRTAMFGKWHSGTQYPYHPNARGFEEFYGFCSGHWGNYWNPILEHNGKIVKGEGFIADDLTNHALEYIKGQKNHPFFLYLAFNTPHTPMQIPDTWWNGIKNRKLTQAATNPDAEEIGTTKSALALAENIDWNVGRLLNLLEELNIEEETIILYFSDNGPNGYRWNGGMKGKKGAVDEGGVRSPLCIRWPGHIQGGVMNEQLSGAIDLMPTLLGLTGVKYESKKPLDGIDLSKQLLDSRKKEQDRVLYSYWSKKLSVRIPGFMLDNDQHLYQTSVDRGQLNDLSGNNTKELARLKSERVKFEKEILPCLPKKDERPFLIGHPEEYSSKLPARDAKIEGMVERSNTAPNCSYFTNWRSTDARILWNVDVLESGTFEVKVYYTCDARNIGSVVNLKTDRGESLRYRLGEVNDAPMQGADMDRVPRKSESYMKDFKPFSMGKIHLEKGKALLSLQAESIASEEVMNFWLLELIRKK